jgi:hypothetical protein
METLAGQVVGVDVLPDDVVLVLVEMDVVVVEALEVLDDDDDDGGVVPEPLIAISAHPR